MALGVGGFIAAMLGAAAVGGASGFAQKKMREEAEARQLRNAILQQSIMKAALEGVELTEPMLKESKVPKDVWPILIGIAQTARRSRAEAFALAERALADDGLGFAPGVPAPDAPTQAPPATFAQVAPHLTGQRGPSLRPFSPFDPGSAPPGPAPFPPVGTALPPASAAVRAIPSLSGVAPQVAPQGPPTVAPQAPGEAIPSPPQMTPALREAMGGRPIAPTPTQVAPMPVVSPPQEGGTLQRVPPQAPTTPMPQAQVPAPDARRGELGTLRRPDGGLSTELSITVTDPRLNGGRPTNIPLLVQGQTNVDALLRGEPWTGQQQEIAVRRAVERQRAGERLPSFGSIHEAEAAAQARSAAGGSTAAAQDAVFNSLVEAGRQRGPATSRSVTVSPPGTGVSITRTRPAETPESRGQRVLQQAMGLRKRGYDVSLEQIQDAAIASGAIIPDGTFKMIANRESMKAYRDELAALRRDGFTGQAAEREASRRAFERTGYVHDKLPSPFTSDAEASAAAVQRVIRRVDEGATAIQALNAAQREGLRISAEDRKNVLQQEYGRLLTAHIQAGIPRRDAIQLAAIAVNFEPGVIPPNDLAQLAPQVRPETAEVIASRGGSPERPADIRAAREQLRAEEIAQEAAKTTARRFGEFAGPMTPTEARDVQVPLGTTGRQAAGIVPKAQPSAEQQQRSEDRLVMLRETDHILSTFQRDWVGPWREAKVPFTGLSINAARRRFGLIKGDEAAFRANVQSVVNDIIFALSGKQVGQLTEAERLSIPIPSLDDTPDQFVGKLHELKRRLVERFNVQQDVQSSSGVRALPAQSRPAPQPGTSAAPTGERFIVRNKKTGARAYSRGVIPEGWERVEE